MSLLKEKYAAPTADEIERRGWVNGDLAETTIRNPDFDVDKAEADEISWDEEYIPVPLEDCRVCLLGGLGAAYYGNPEKGMGHSDPEYVALVSELADYLNPGWRTERYSDDSYEPYAGQLRYARYDRETGTRIELDPMEVVYTWNDAFLDQDGQQAVVSKLREIAAT